ncbi:molybdopterin-dependent oxidoreductase [Adlercreutzia sp. ZJ154]|uniref:molybdopterin-dependent oxidoreductase n=1 Tax=Adlercreutzia sp. ZJ154 TaxID=2709790 RepID=UPI0013ECFD72|nr:molybdopterin-dependent oxidoreductase [Adlercreutzia sp. ZJ154]
MDQEWRTVLEDGTCVTRSCAWSPPGDHPVGCGVRLFVKDGKLVKVEGDPDHPVTKGRLCPRCLTLPEYLNHPDRILYPMKRNREDRGKDAWKRISWDEALDLITDEVVRARETYGAESIVEFTGTGRQAVMYCMMFANGILGTPNVCYSQSGYSCYGPRTVATAYVMGVGYPEIDNACRFPDTYDHPGWQRPNYIILWGKAPLESNPDGFFGHSIIDLMKRGTKIISIDPRINWIGTKAEYHLQLRPGTDAALAMAMLNVIIGEDLYDHDFVENWTYGFDELAERVKDATPEWAEEITWVKADKIREVARIYAKNTPSSIAWGLAIDQNKNGVQAGHAIMALMVITGNFDVPGGISVGMRDNNLEPLQSLNRWEILPDETRNKMIGKQEYPALTNVLGQCQPDLVLDALETGDPYQLHVGFFESSNLLTPTACAQPKRWRDALRKLDFIFALDTFMNPTIMACADVVLPLASYAEGDGVVLTHYGLNVSFVGPINKALSMGECKSEIEVMLDLAKRLNPDEWSWKTPEEVLNAKLGGLTFEKLREMGVYQPQVEYKKHEKGLIRPDGQPGVNTPTGKIELYSTVFESFGEDPLPYYTEPPYSPVSQPELAKEFPLILTTGARTFASFHSEHRQVPSLRRLVPDPIVEINPETADEYGIKEGDWVLIKNMFGEAREKAHLTPLINKNVVHAQHGWWYPEEDPEEPNLFGNWKSNVNSLMPHKQIGHLGFGSNYKSTICSIELAD